MSFHDKPFRIRERIKIKVLLKGKKMRYIYLVHTATTSLLGRAIGTYTKNRYNHVSLALDEELTLVYSFGRKQPNNPFLGGFVRENLTSGLFEDASCCIYRLPIETEDYERLLELITVFDATKAELRYNLLGLVFLACRLNITREHHFFCSQFVAKVLHESVMIELDKAYHLTTPQDLTKIEGLEQVFQGELSHYFT